MIWNPETYNKFGEERAQPFEDLFRLVTVKSGLQVIDLGCGTGQLTSQLAERLPDSEVLGIDSSPEMLAAARKLERPSLRFELRAIEDAQGEWDLVFSHAVIQWLEDHTNLIHRLFSLVRVGGQLAVQLPDNYDSTPHGLIKEAARDAPFSSALGGWTRDSTNLKLEDYAQLLYEHCGNNFTAFAKIYPLILKNADAVLDWQAGTALLPYMQRLPEDMQQPFRERYRELLWEHYPHGPVFIPFRRILFAGTRVA